MLTLNKIILTQFKNYQQTSFDFKERITGICGLNGKGKTNLLDAIYYLCFTKSYFSGSDILNVQFNTDGFRLQGCFTKSFSKEKSFAEDSTLVAIFRGTGKKEILINDIAYEKFSAHIGKFPAVIIAPDDVEMIMGSSEERRKFMDTVLSQMNAGYLQQLIIYNKVLQQRNSLLKRFAEQGKVDRHLLDVLDEQLIIPGKQIHLARKIFTEELIPMVKKFYSEIADNNEAIDLHYHCLLNEYTFEGILKKYRDRDLLLQRSNAGIHKDDLTAELNGKIFKNIASQGQRKSLLFALKLAEFDLLKKNKGFAPLLLLDDVFEKLDDNRMKNLLQWVCINNTGQVFITDTHEERLTAYLSNFNKNVQIIQLN